MYFHKVHTGVLGPTRFPSRVLVTMHTSAEGTNTDAPVHFILIHFC